MANIELLDRTMAEIESDPDGWDQSEWQKCFAGIGLRLGDWTYGWHVFEHVDEDGPWWDDRTVFFPPNNPEDPWLPDDAGREVFDLTPLQSLALFRYSNTRETLRRIVAEIKASA